MWDLRMPRVLTAMLVGAALAVAGATFQGLIRNPLADPYVLGTASGAALGAAIAVVIPVHFVIVEFGLLHGLAFAFALLTAFVVVKLGGGGSGGAHAAVADRLCGRLDPRRVAHDGDVHVRPEPARDLLVPARRARRLVVDPPGRRRADHPRRVRR